MLILGKPKDGVSARFLKGPWIVGQVYVMLTMIFGVVGTSVIIVNELAFLIWSPNSPLANNSLLSVVTPVADSRTATSSAQIERPPTRRSL